MSWKTVTKIEFEGSKGTLLAARLDRPLTTPHAYAIFAHCFTCSKDLNAAARISRALASRGIAVLRFDFTGLGHSKGEFANTNFTSNVDDLLRAADWLRTHHAAPELLVGHSLGGAAVLAAAGRIPECRAVATLGAPALPSHVEHLFGTRVREIEEKGRAELELSGRRFEITREFLDDVREQKQTERIHDLKRALLVMHSPDDELVPIAEASKIFGAAQHPKSFVALDETDHLITSASSADYAAGVLASWADRYLTPREPDDNVEDGEVLVDEAGSGKFVQEVTVGRHRLLGDEPKKVGGDDAGPTPYGFLLAALGTCTSMTIRMYTDHKGWDLDDVRVKLRHQKVHAADCEDCETQTGVVDQIVREITLIGDLSEEQRRRIMAIADRCPVHKTLHNEVKIPTVEVAP